MADSATAALSGRPTANPLLALGQFGQSYWLDDLTRSMIASGELQRRVKEEGLTGVTTNPAIFRAAIGTDDAYDRQIRSLAMLPVNAIYEALIVADVRDACDVLRPVYDRTEGRDGFVSLEVSPHLAHNAAGSIEQARRFWLQVGRPNLLIKIPGTFEGLAAVEELLTAGINVNITLLFGVDRYEEVALAYMSALERRRLQKAPLDRIASVASFFLSRIDTAVDEFLLQRARDGKSEAQGLLGKTAIASAKLAYRRYQELTASGRWRALQGSGARPQRLLWASTSAKNPAYDRLMYVEQLIGPQTVNTLPKQTIAEFAQHGTAKATLEQGLDEAARMKKSLLALGIDVELVTRQLLDDGIRKFTDSFNEILKTIAARAIPH